MAPFFHLCSSNDDWKVIIFIGKVFYIGNDSVRAVCAAGRLSVRAPEGVTVGSEILFPKTASAKYKYLSLHLQSSKNPRNCLSPFS